MDDDGLTPAYIRLAMRIVLLAIKDAQDNNGHATDARAFLTGWWGRGFCEALDIDLRALDALLVSLPAPSKQQLALEMGGC